MGLSLKGEAPQPSVMPCPSSLVLFFASPSSNELSFNCLAVNKAVQADDQFYALRSDPITAFA
jgi:hypothetical protein